MPLEEYRRKRRFRRTPEPSGPAAREAMGPRRPDVSGRRTRFVVQKHRARRLHYDLRLEMDGVLKSWAVPKGPSLNPADKRLAVLTEDHPMDYGRFEGIIPEGNYGAGTVMVWDRGLYEMVGEASAGDQLARGELKFTVYGEKLRGGFALVKLRHSEKGNEWLLIKHKDLAEPKWNIEEHDGSVLTGRTLDEIAEELPPKRSLLPLSPEEVEGAHTAPMPARVEPMLAVAMAEPFSDPAWLYEIKWDGVRALAWVKDGAVELRSRAGRVITKQYPEVAELPARLRASQAILDGEIVVLDERGRSQFERLQERMHVSAPPAALVAKAPVTYYVFDLLYCDGYDLREAPLVQRKHLLRRLLATGEPVRFCDHQPEHGRELFDLAREQGLEGVVAKRAESPYVSTRSTSWVKLKSRRELDAVVVGWTAPRAGREHFGALLLGLYDGNALRFIGHVGAGFDQKTQKEIIARLKKLGEARCPFEPVPETNEQACWVKPGLVVRVQYSGATQEQRLREPVFLGLRPDLKAEDCQVESEAAVPQRGAAPAVVTASAIAGRVLAKKAQIEAELFKGRAENVTLEIEGKRFRLSNLNKVYFPESGYTKRDLVAYYYRVAGRLLPFLADRPLVLRRYPDGIGGQSFFQKDMGEAVPEWLEIVEIPSEHRGEEIRFVIANDLATLLYLTNLGCIDHNPWSSRRDALEHPDYFFFDLDPAEGTEFRTVVEVAGALYEKLDEVGVSVFLKTSGATGLHLYVPVERGYTYEELRTFAEIVARLATAEVPDLVTHERAVAKRKAGKVYIDVSQNAYGRPLAAVYVVRAFPKAPVSAPLTPKLLRPSLSPEKLNMKTIFAWLDKHGDPWQKFWKSRQRLEKAIAALSGQLPRRGKG